MREDVSEAEAPQQSVEPPAGDPASLYVRLYQILPGPVQGYTVELHGDGQVVFNSITLGKHTYQVDPETVRRLAGKAAAVDFWSLNGYPPGTTGLPAEWLTIGYGPEGPGQVAHEVANVWPGKRGIPASLADLNTAIIDAAQVSTWWPVTDATVARLEQESFDFRSDAAVLLPITAMADERVSDALIMRLLDKVPLATGDGTMRRLLLEHAIMRRRKPVIDRLLALHFLDEDGSLSPLNVDRAFCAALMSGSLPLVDMMLAYHPRMACPGEGLEVHYVSPMFRVGRQGDVEAIAQRLSDLGVGIGGYEDGRSTLAAASMAGNSALVGFLLKKGADPNALAAAEPDPMMAPPLNLPALCWTSSEDVALQLLAAGARPDGGDRNDCGHFGRWATDNHWIRVIAWLKANGYADWLQKQRNPAAA